MLSVLLAAIVAVGSPAAAGTGPQLYRLSDKVGDTIDLAERDEHRLFPGVPGFRSAVVLVGDSSDYQIEIESYSNDTLRIWTASLVPAEVERIRFVIENPEHMEQELATNENAQSVMDRFWGDIQSRLVPKGGGAAGLQPVSAEGRMHGTVVGMSAGACLGGAAGAASSMELVSSEPAVRSGTCLGCLSGKTEIGCGPCMNPYTYERYTIFTYSMDAGKFALVSVPIMGACAVGGYLTGLASDRRVLPEPPGREERNTWRTALCVTGGIVGAAVGAVASSMLLMTTDGSSGGGWTYDEYHVENLPGIAIVQIFTSALGIAVESAYAGYVVGRRLDQRTRRPRAAAGVPSRRSVPYVVPPSKP